MRENITNGMKRKETITNGMKGKENISSQPLVDPSPVTEPLCSPLIEQSADIKEVRPIKLVDTVITM